MSLINSVFEDLYLEDSRNGVSKPSKVRGQGYPMVNMGEIFQFDRIDDSTPMELVPLSDNELKNSLLRYGDLLFARQSLVVEGAGKCSIFLGTDDKTTFESHLIRVRLDTEKSNPLFFYYFFNSNLGKARVRSLVNQVAAAGIRGSDLKRIKITYPSLDDQREIASLISKYDNLIENNEKRIKILEEMAQRLYIEWFVNFKFPGHEKVTMIDSPVGNIPEGWKVVRMSEIASFVNGYPFKPAELGDRGLPIVKIPELRSGILDKTPRNNGKSIPKKYLVRNGDILFSWSATLMVNIWNSGNALLNQHLFKVQPMNKTQKSYVFFVLKKLVETLSKHVVGATMQHLRRGTIVDSKILLPNSTILEIYEEHASTYIQEIGNLQMQKQVLQEARDLLIPQLVSGKRELNN